MRNQWTAAFAILVLAGCSSGPPEAGELLSDTMSAMGASELTSIQYSADGADFCLGQPWNTTSGWPRFNLRNYTRVIDLETGESQMTAIRSQGENPPRGGCGQPILNEQNQNQVVTADSPWAQQLAVVLTPYGFLKRAMASDPTVSTAAVNGEDFNVVSFTEGKHTVNGYINGDNILTKVETWLENPVLGDMPVEADFMDYQSFDGVMFPAHLVESRGGFPTLDLMVSAVQPNIEVDIRPPESKKGFGKKGGPVEAKSERVAPGVYWITGGYNAAAVEFNDHIVIIEGPQSESRAQDIIAEAKRVIPNKPIRFVVNTHLHFDHSSGLPAFVAEGATIITHESNRAYYEKAFSAPRTLEPDAMSQSGKPPVFETMTEMKTLTDGDQTIELHHIVDSPHAQDLIVAYLPKYRIVVEADIFNPPFQANAPAPEIINPFHTNFIDNIERLGLKVDLILPIHGRKTNRAELYRMAGRN